MTLHHHEAGPSQLGRIMLCLGSMALAERARKEGSALEPFREEAQRGTDLHSLLPLTATIPDTIDQTDSDAVWAARHWIAEKTQGAATVEYEVRVELSCGIFGTVDVLARWADGRTFIGDVKFGLGALVPSSIEWQMKAYAASQFYGCSVGVFQALDKTEYLATFTAAECEALDSEISRIYYAAQKPDAPLNPSPDACRYCPATGICPAFDKQMLAVAVRSNEALPLDISRLVHLYEACKLVESRIDAIREAMKAAITSGAIAGYRLKPVTVRQAPSKVEIFSKNLLNSELLGAAKFSVGDLERTLGKARFREYFPNLQTTIQERIEKL